MKKLFMLIALMVLSLGILTGCGNSESVMEEAAQRAVTEIYAEQFGIRVNCLRVKITEQIDSKHYRANATLDNGNDIRIMIEDRGDNVYVSTPLQQ